MMVIFVGSVIDPQMQFRLAASSAAGNGYQYGLIRGIANAGVQVSVVSVTPRAMWRRRGDALVERSSEYPLTPSVNARGLFFLNLPGVKQMCIAAGVFSALLRRRRHASGNSGERTILVYNTLSYEFLPALLARRFLGDRLGVIVADLPLRRTRSGLTGALERFEHWLEIKSLSYADFLIPLSYQTQIDFGQGRPYLILEGGWAGVAPIEPSGAPSSSPPFKLVYAGSLNSVSGVDLAIEAVRMIPTGEVVLDIYGSGSPEQVEAVTAAQSAGIVYHGALDRAAILEIERAADALLLPRRPDDFVTRYTFPSKLIEYMASGTPVIGNWLAGIPDEYLDYMHIPDDPSPESWSKMILRLCRDHSGSPQRLAARAQSFIQAEKVWDKQGARLAEFLGKGHHCETQE